LLKTAEKMLKEADVAHSLTDEERAYILYMKYFNVVQLIKKTADYKKQKDYFDSLLGQKNLLKAIDRAEELSSSLKDRYDLIEAEQVAEKLASLDKKSSIDVEDGLEDTKGEDKKSSTEDDSGTVKSDIKKEESVESSKSPTKISPTELYALLQDKETKIVIMDVRTENQFKESHIQHDNCINIPAEIITPGTTVTYISKGLPDQSKTLWYQRGTMDHIILMDWNSTLDKVQPRTTLCTLKDALYKYDSSVIIKSEPLVLEGGYDQWLLYYPQLTTNAHIVRPEKTIVTSSSSTLDFDYPDFDEAFMTTPTPTAPQPQLNNHSTTSTGSHDTFGQSRVVNNLFGQNMTDTEKAAFPKIDRSTKPKPGAQNQATMPSQTTSSSLSSSMSSSSKSSSMYPSINLTPDPKNNLTKVQNKDANLLSSATSSVPASSDTTKLASYSSQLEKEREELERLRRQKEEELNKFEKEKERIAREYEEKLERLAQDEKKLQEMKQDQTKDVANLMRMKKSLESDMKSEQSQGKAEQEYREKELARLQQEEEIKKKRQAEVERLRQERKKKEEEEERIQRSRDEAERQALLMARERAKQEEERKRRELEEAERKAELLRQQEAKAKEEFERIRQEQIKQQEIKHKEEADRARKEELRKAEMERKEQEIKKREEEERIQRLREDQERKEREKKEKELQEKERADQARREAEAKLKRLELSNENTKPKVIPSPNLPTGWEKRLDPQTRRYYYIDHNTATTQWEPPTTPVSQQSGTYTTRLREEPTTPRRGLTRSNSSPNIAKMMTDEDKGPSIPTIDRASKPKPKYVDNIVIVSKKTEILQQPLVRPSPPRRAIHRDLNPIYGNVGRALTGLRNLGNTCYMNSTIQCLNNTSPLITYFLTDSYLYDINRENEMGSHGEVVDEFAVIVKALWSGQYRCITPRDFKFMVGKHQPMFAGHDQQDSQEFLTFLMDGLHEGLNTVKKRPKVPEQDNDNLPDSEAAAIAWKHHKMLHKSVIVELFQGQLKSTLMCLTCRKQSVTFQAFMYLSLPIPSGSRCSLGDCFRQFLREEKMTGSSRWKCPRCKVERDSVKKIDLWKLPGILLIGLNRFVYEGQWRQKISSYVDFPVKNLDLGNYVKAPSYNLYGISVSTSII
ncbi:hypothetical protein FSP39_020374, partial [Pinctada imbricata]